MATLVERKIAMQKHNQKQHPFWLFLFSFLVLTGCGTTPKKEPFTLDEKPSSLEVGQEFVYFHTGPLPWGDGRLDVTGRRIVAVTGLDPENKNRFLVEDQFEQVEGSQINVIDQDYRLQRQEMEFDEGILRVEFNPPMPIRYLTIAEGEEKTFNIKQKLVDKSTKKEVGSASIQFTTKRENDERIITQAGAYMCRHFISRIEISSSNILDEKTFFTTTEDTYWCDKIGWFVKRIYHFDPLVQEGTPVRPAYNTESILTGFNAEYGSVPALR